LFAHFCTHVISELLPPPSQSFDFHLHLFFVGKTSKSHNFTTKPSKNDYICRHNSNIKKSRYADAAPLFPTNTKLIKSTVGFREQDGTVYYLHNGNPIYCHSIDNRNGYRFILANLVVNKLCKISELSVAMGEGRKNIERYAKAFREQGAGYFFGRKERRGQCYKMTAGKLSAIQSNLDSGLSIYRTALNHDVSESAISYHIRSGKLKKKLFINHQ
jgi:hypothetical protein